jgi:hypothetical protein
VFGSAPCRGEGRTACEDDPELTVGQLARLAEEEVRGDASVRIRELSVPSLDDPDRDALAQFGARCLDQLAAATEPQGVPVAKRDQRRVGLRPWRSDAEVRECAGNVA